MGEIRIPRQEFEDRLSSGELKPEGQIKNGWRNEMPWSINNLKFFSADPMYSNSEIVCSFAFLN